METKANYALIGLFTLGVIGAAFGFVWWFSAATRGSEKIGYRVVFQGSVSGLSRGSLVRFNGLRVGEVTEISLVSEDPRLVQSFIEVDPKTPIKTDTRARLEFQGLTGVANIQLTGGSPEANALVNPDRTGKPTIFADRSDFQDILETVQRFAGRADTIMSKVEKLVDDNESNVAGTVRNLQNFSKALSDNSAGVSAFLASVGDVSQRISTLSQRLESMAQPLEDLVRAVDGASVRRVIGNVDSFAQALGDGRAQVSAMLGDASSLVSRLNGSSARLDEVMADLSRLSRTIDAEKLNRTFENMEKFSAGLGDGKVLERVIGNADAFTQSLADNRGNVSALLQDSASLGRRLNETTAKLDTALGDFSKLAQGIDPARINRTFDSLDKFTSMLGTNSGEVEKTLEGASALVSKLNLSAEKLDRVLVAAEGFLGTGSGATTGVMSEIGQTARSFRALAGNLEKRISELSASIGRLSGAGARDLGTMVEEVRNSLGHLNRTVRSIERNPQQFLFGSKPALPEYGARR